MRAGRMRQRASLYRRTASRNQYNEEVITWQLYGYAWLAFEDVAATEQEQGGRNVQVTTATARTRYRTDIAATDQLRIGSDSWEPESVVDVNGLRREIVMQLKKVD